MPDWSQLQDAYGAADEVPRLLAALTPDPDADVWGELWSRICHQGSVYSASFAALPELLAAAASWAPRDRLMILSLAAHIVCGETLDGIHDGLGDEYQSLRSAFEALARESLGEVAPSDTDVVCLAQAVLAFGGDRLWGLQLDRLIDGEFEGRCPACGALASLVVGPYGFFATADEWITRPPAVRHAIHAAPAEALSGVGAWLHAEAVRASRDTLALWFRHLFGDTTCPSCSAPMSVQAAIEHLHRD